MSKAKNSGFYNRQFSQGEVQDALSAGEAGLWDEIIMLRVAMRRTIEMANEVETLQEMTQTLKALAIAAGRLAELMRVQSKAAGEEPSLLAAALSQALAEVRAEMGIQGP